MTNIFRRGTGKRKRQGETFSPETERGGRNDFFRVRCLFFFACAILLMTGSVPATSHAGEAASQPASKEGQSPPPVAGNSAFAAADPDGQGAAAESVKKPGVLRSNLLNISIRGRFSGLDVLGGTATEEFQEFDAAAQFRLPWGWYSQPGWGGELRLMAGAGVLYGAGETALAVSLIPMLAFGSKDGRFSLDMGAGPALLSRHRFGDQDYGGYFQFALTAGLSVPVFRGFGVGYRFLHYSDAALYGHHTTGADFHMLEIHYRF
ncbi:MAG: acyloxyacyl hydrolase [Smithellaceae bacterium]|jgi:hypothetical protein|nr:acyloxyacyl hydrolase [Smithellaceae bacterium]MDD3259120.1 acyloxyacyl hydrolase [Smithellaceae bacterium]MDD3849179.1 acyloxyacyl hydrolase [Smithellaceae bacterium]HOG12750.1 acyloxyacyl hydrolase [Smithellaceae bacterium]HOQ72449.1 acyloxyacyl hydrolase [Smithellaceae bacterium]